jgi:hypothetical protein
MFYYLNLESQIRRISKNVGFLNKPFEISSDNVLRDIVDGGLYKKLLYKNREAFTLTLNTDGISLRENSTLSMWPVFACLNEIAPQERFCVYNVIILSNV